MNEPGRTVAGWRAKELWLLGVTGAFLAPVVGHSSIGWFTRYIADDYCLAVTRIQEGLPGAFWFWFGYQHGSVSFIAAALLASLVPPGMVRYWPALALSVWLALLAWIVWQLRPAASAFHRAAVSVLLAGLTLSATLEARPRVVAEAVYWLDGALRYLAPQIALAACVALGLRWHGRDGTTRVRLPRLLAFGLLAFVAASFSEVTMAAQMTAFVLGAGACLALVSSTERCRVLPWLAAGVAGTTVAALVTVLAPGTGARQSVLGDTPGALVFGQQTIGYTFEYVRERVARAPFQLLVAILAPALAARRFGRGLDAGRLEPWLVGLPVGIGVVLLACFAPAGWAISHFPPGRTLLAPQFWLFGGLVAWGYLAGAWSRSRGLGLSSRVRGLELAALMGCAVVPILTTVELMELRPRAEAYALTWEAFDRQLRQASREGAASVRVPAPENLAGLDVVGDDPAFWVNGCVGAYYGLTVTGYPPPGVPDADRLDSLQPQDAALGAVARIAGYRLGREERAGAEALALTVHWIPRETTAAPLRVRVALEGSAGTTIAAEDHAIAAGEYDTTVWTPGRPFLATYLLEIPGDVLAPGEATLMVGLEGPDPASFGLGAEAPSLGPVPLTTVRFSSGGCGRPLLDVRAPSEAERDARLASLIEERLRKDAVVGPLEIEVGVLGSVATLCDDQTNQDQRDRAVALARGVEGIVEVVDRMK